MSKRTRLILNAIAAAFAVMLALGFWGSPQAAAKTPPVCEYLTSRDSLVFRAVELTANWGPIEGDRVCRVGTVRSVEVAYQIWQYEPKLIRDGPKVLSSPPFIVVMQGAHLVGHYSYDAGELFALRTQGDTLIYRSRSSHRRRVRFGGAAPARLKTDRGWSALEQADYPRLPCIDLYRQTGDIRRILRGHYNSGEEPGALACRVGVVRAGARGYTIWTLDRVDQTRWNGHGTQYLLVLEKGRLFGVYDMDTHPKGVVGRDIIFNGTRDRLHFTADGPPPGAVVGDQSSALSRY